MTTETPDGVDYDPGTDELFHDSKGNPIDSDYIDRVNREAKISYALDDLAPTRVGRPPCPKPETLRRSGSAFPKPLVQKRLRSPLAREDPLAARA